MKFISAGKKWRKLASMTMHVKNIVFNLLLSNQLVLTHGYAEFLREVKTEHLINALHMINTLKGQFFNDQN